MQEGVRKERVLLVKVIYRCYDPIGQFLDVRGVVISSCCIILISYAIVYVILLVYYITGLCIDISYSFITYSAR